MAAQTTDNHTERQTEATHIRPGVNQVFVMAVYGGMSPHLPGPLTVFDLIKGKRVHQFQAHGGEMTVHKLKVSISVERGGGRPIINIEDNSVCNVTRLESLSSFQR